jgi:hypothetical protein
MKLLSIEIENQPVNWKEVDPELMKAEARRLFDLQQADTIRQVYFKADTKSAVIEWEADSIETVNQIINDFPLVKAGYIHFDVFPLIPYTGYKRLFG